MRFLLSILKRIGIFLSLFLFLILISGLMIRIFHSPQPSGELIDVEGYKLHINSTGEKNSKPTVIIEGGDATPTDYYYWLSEGLKDSLRVIRYDRAGIGYSELKVGSRDMSIRAHELHSLLKKAGESPPYILVGHSRGGIAIRVFTKLYPNEVAALVFLDATHPNINERFKAQLSLPDRPNVSWRLQTMEKIADLGVLNLFDRVFGPMATEEGLPKKLNKHFLDYTANGKYIRGIFQERNCKKTKIDLTEEASHLDNLPIRFFTASRRNYNWWCRSVGIEKCQSEWVKLQQEIAGLYKNSKHIAIEGDHNTIYTKKENATIICKEILSISNELEN